jgi:hypothetical protein
VADINLTQEDADALLAMEKHKADDAVYERNPDDGEIPCPHLHLYREGNGDRWATPLPAERFSDAGDPWLLLLEFMQFVNATVPPDIRRGLFT